MNTSLIFIAPIMLASTLARAQDARLDVNCVPQMTGLEARLYQKAGEGPDTLRDFLSIRRGIYQLDMADTQIWAAKVDAARSACKKVAEPAGDKPQPVALALIAAR